jgi:hypothetical protein
MRESLTYGTVGGRLGNHRLYPEADQDGSVDAEIKHVRKATGRYRVSKDRGRENELKEKKRKPQLNGWGFAWALDC